LRSRLDRAASAGSGGAAGGPGTGRIGPIVIMLLVALSGCASSGLKPIEPATIDRTAARLDEVPFVAGDDGHCGPAALAMVLRWSGSERTSDQLVSRLLTPTRNGTFEHDLISFARAEGRLAVPVNGFEAVAREVAAGHPVIVLQNLGLSWYPQWHYAVVTGYDLLTGSVWLHSGQDANRRMSLDTFRQTFERAGERALVVLPPAALPTPCWPRPPAWSVPGARLLHDRPIARSSIASPTTRPPPSGSAMLSSHSATWTARPLRSARVREAAACAHRP
jgi:hypothetical protein